MPPDLVLVSTSPYRRELMAKMGFRFRAVAPRFEENHVHNGDPGELALALARGKAMSVAGDYPHAILIGSDQVVWCDGRVLAKAGTPERAWRELQSLRGRTHEFYMGLYLSATRSCVPTLRWITPSIAPAPSKPKARVCCCSNAWIAKTGPQSSDCRLSR
ncbi:Maf family protein [candidate division KSB1 bacterium]|nr:Maf family protein [candidate division KSB1 bacterium]